MRGGEMEQEGLLVKILRRFEQAQEEVKQRAEELVCILNEQPREHWEQTATWLDVVAQWERAETLLGALEHCLQITRERSSLTMRNMSRQLRRFRREEGKGQVGWIEVRTVKGHQYIYYRYRRPGERTIQTEYYGRADRLLEELAVGAAVRRAYQPCRGEDNESST